MTPTNPVRQRPSLERLEGGTLPRPLSFAHSMLTGSWPPARRLLTRLAPRVIGDRLPAMISRFPDGRAFRIPAGDTMYAQVFTYGAYEPAESALVSRLLRPGDFAIDVGANHGWYSLLMAATVGKAGLVWAVEPVPAMLAELRANTALNPELPIEIKPLALGEGSGSVKLHLFAGLAHGHASISTLGRDDFAVHEVEMRSLDELLEDAPTSPSVVKVDVEGAERSVIEGAQALLGGDAPPIWMIEVNTETSRAFGYQPADLVSALAEVRPHAVYRVTEGGLELDPEPASTPHGTTWICVPDGRQDRVNGLVRLR